MLRKSHKVTFTTHFVTDLYLDCDLNNKPYQNNQLTPPTQNNVAVLDIGSNSFHLIIVSLNPNELSILHKAKYKVGLAEDLINTGLLSPEAIATGLETLKQINSVVDSYPIDHVRIIATQALRSAKNTEEFINQAQKVFPYPIEVISGKEEARLIYKGVVSREQASEVQLVIDIGGGSSEFVIGQSIQAKLLNSINIGCVSFTNQFFSHGELSQHAFNQAIDAACKQIEPISAEYIAHSWDVCFGTSGSIESIFSVMQMMKIGNQVNLHNLETLMSQIITFKSANLLKLGVINEDRKCVFPAGLAILIAMFRTLKISHMEFSQADLGQGVAFELMEQQD
jgi:exopolyphosphatase/guanosine-5'-triphosphate,3'-diphosphate pyrophosphatase